MSGVGRQLLETLRERQLEFFGHIMKRNGLQKLVVNLLVRLKVQEQQGDKG